MKSTSIISQRPVILFEAWHATCPPPRLRQSYTLFRQEVARAAVTPAPQGSGESANSSGD